MFKLIKYLIYAVLAFFAICFVAGLLMDEDDLSTEDNSEVVEKKTTSDKKKSAAGDWGDGKVKSISQDQFKTLVANYSSNKNKFIGKGPVVVDCYATWCGPCQGLAPVLEKVAKKYKGQVQFYKVDVDKCPAVSNAYNIRSIPLLMFCADGKIEMVNGAPSQRSLESAIEDMLD